MSTDKPKETGSRTRPGREEPTPSESPSLLRVQEHPYSRLFFLKNRDPANYVLSKDFFYWSIITLYLFLIWYFVLIFENHNFLSRTNEGGIVLFFSLVAAVCLFFVFMYGYYQKIRNVYPLLGLGYSLLLVSMGVLVFNFEKNEINRGFEHDPVQIAYTFLIVYSFVAFFLI